MCLYTFSSQIALFYFCANSRILHVLCPQEIYKHESNVAELLGIDIVCMVWSNDIIFVLYQLKIIIWHYFCDKMLFNHTVMYTVSNLYLKILLTCFLSYAPVVILTDYLNFHCLAKYSSGYFYLIFDNTCTFYFVCTTWKVYLMHVFQVIFTTGPPFYVVIRATWRSSHLQGKGSTFIS